MAIFRRQKLNETFHQAPMTSIGATPAAAYFLMPRSGTLFYAGVVGEAGTLAGTDVIAISLNGVAVSGATFSVSNGAAPADVGSGDFAIPVNEGDVITLTPSGGTGATITANATLGIRGTA
jgi:hypothetical protein